MRRFRLSDLVEFAVYVGPYVVWLIALALGLGLTWTVLNLLRQGVACLCGGPGL